MKKLHLITGLALTALMTGCASEEPMGGNEQANAASDNAINLAFHATNITRSDSPFENTAWQFGVWAFKGDSESDIAYDSTDASQASVTNMVMKDYMVGYWNNDNQLGYKPTTQNTYGTSWYYEGLGTDQTSMFTFQGDATHTAAVPSHNTEQFLKYWDGSVDHTYFYGYAPYTASVGFVANAASASLKFPAINAGSGSNYMYALTREKNEAHVLQGNTDKVDLKFYRLASQIRLAFYEELDGYDVELVDYNATNEGVYMVPSKKEAGGYSLGKYTSEAKPTVTFNAIASDGQTVMATPATVSVSYEGAQKVSTSFNWTLASFADKNGDATTELGDGYADRIFGEWKAVVPADAANPNDGLTLNVTLKLTAHHTGEVLYINNARVHVDASYTKWQSNSCYTYVFRITKTAPGSTVLPTDDPNPDFNPNPNQALFPIVFENVTVEDYQEVLDNGTNVWHVNAD